MTHHSTHARGEGKEELNSVRDRRTLVECHPPTTVYNFPYVDDPLLARCFAVFDQIACVHMSGLFVRSHMNAGQDGFRDKSSKQNGDLKRATGKCGMSLVGDRLIT